MFGKRIKNLLIIKIIHYHYINKTYYKKSHTNPQFLLVVRTYVILLNQEVFIIVYQNCKETNKTHLLIDSFG